MGCTEANIGLDSGNGMAAQKALYGCTDANAGPAALHSVVPWAAAPYRAVA